MDINVLSEPSNAAHQNTVIRSSKTAVIFGTFCLVVLVVFVPILFSEINQMFDELEADTSNFKSITNDIWKDMLNLAKLRQVHYTKTKRSGAPSAASPPGSSCNCNEIVCQVGEPGSPGLAGEDGLPGLPGTSGKPGTPAENEESFVAKMPCMQCPAGEPGPKGPRGAPGPPGKPGEFGASGSSGKSGRPGETGPPGDAGPPGVPGHRGPNGLPGRDGMHVRGRPGPKGPPGLPGQEGPRGPPGSAGLAKGPAGPIGLPGLRGRSGLRGIDGTPGSKGPRGIAGNNAGYCPCVPTTGPTGPAGQPSSNSIAVLELPGIHVNSVPVRLPFDSVLRSPLESVTLIPKQRIALRIPVGGAAAFPENIISKTTPAQAEQQQFTTSSLKPVEKQELKPELSIRHNFTKTSSEKEELFPSPKPSILNQNSIISINGRTADDNADNFKVNESFSALEESKKQSNNNSLSAELDYGLDTDQSSQQPKLVFPPEGKLVFGTGSGSGPGIFEDVFETNSTVPDPLSEIAVLDDQEVQQEDLGKM